MSRTIGMFLAIVVSIHGNAFAAPHDSKPDPSSVGSTPYISVINDNSAPELTLRFTVSLVGVVNVRTYDIPLRKMSEHQPGKLRVAVPFNIMTNADGVSKDGKGTGFTFSVFARPGERGMEIRVWASWTLPNQRGESEVEFSIPYLEAASGSGGGFDYSCEWIAPD